MAAILKALKIDGTSLLVAVAEYDVNVYKSVRNLADVSVVPVAELNALNVLHPRRLLMTTSALDAFRAKAEAETHGSRRRKPSDFDGSERRGRPRHNEKTRFLSQREGPAHGPRHHENIVLAPHQIIIRPLVTEKGMHKATRYNAYAFEVNRMAGKDDIRRAVEELFDVKVVCVNTQNRKGKCGGRGSAGSDEELEKGRS